MNYFNFYSYCFINGIYFYSIFICYYLLPFEKNDFNVVLPPLSFKSYDYEESSFYSYFFRSAS